MLTITKEGENVFVNGAMQCLRPTSRPATAIIHIIDSVVNRPIEFSLPATVVDTIATRDTDLSTLEDALAGSRLS